jgi:hypothetical protein
VFHLGTPEQEASLRLGEMLIYHATRTSPTRSANSGPRPAPPPQRCHM